MEINGMVWKAAAAASSVPGPATPTTPGATAGQEDRAGDQRRFEEGLHGLSPAAAVPTEPPAPEHGIAPVQPIEPADAASPADSTESLGDSILRSVEHAHEAYERNLQRINGEIAGPNTETMSVARLMQLQFDVMKFGIDQ